MKCLIWYCKDLYIGNIQVSDKAKDLDNDENTIDDNNCIFPWITIETEQDYNYFDDVLKDINSLKEHFKTNKIVLMPFAHLANSQVSFKTAFRILCDLEEHLKKNGFLVTKGHFGSAKDLKMYSPADKMQVIFRSYPKPEYLK
jgi:hypothetical protein